MNARLANSDSALDLSVLSDASPSYSLPPPPAPHPTIVSQLAPDVLALPASVITLPGSDKVPFHISASGHLVLANFTTERVNGSLVFRQSPLTLDQTTDCSVKYTGRTSSTSPPFNNTSASESESVAHGGDLLSQPVYLLLKRARARDGDQAPLCVEGHNLSELVAFAERLRHFRRKMALSQSQLCQQLSSCFSDQLRFSQSFICRFEKMHVTLRTALNSQPYLRRWLERAELQAGSNLLIASDRKAVGKSRCSADARVGLSSNTVPAAPRSTTSISQPFSASDGSSCASVVEAPLLDLRDHQNRGLDVSRSMPEADYEVRPADPQQQPTLNTNTGELEDVSSLPVRRRRKARTFFSVDAVRRLNAHFDRNPIPRGSELTKLASELGYERESVRMWFCNRRQLETSPNKRPKKQTTYLPAPNS
ncbi:hypothetical protein SprV_0100269100 [Sparganum proliferum]